MSAEMTPEDRTNKISGYKATLSNPNVSRDAKENAQAELKALGASDFDYRDEDADAQNKNPANVAGGLKAATNNPQVSEEGKKEAQQKLDNM